MLAVLSTIANAHIFPCAQKAKTPLTKNGYHDATNDLDAIKLWHKRHPNCNWAVACEISGLFVIDVDPAGISTWKQMLAASPELKNACLDAYKVQTPRGGRHYYWRGVGPSTASKIAPGIDTRGVGGYVLLPGGSTAHGRYIEIQGTIADMPASILKIVESLCISKKPINIEPAKNLNLAINIKWANDIIDRYIVEKNIAVEGQGGNSLTYKVAASVLDKGVSPEKTLQLLQRWNDLCVPPWQNDELFDIILNAKQYGDETKGGKALPPSSEVFKAHELSEAQTLSTGKKTPRLLSILEARQHYKPATWLIADYIPSTGVGMIYGPPGSYKSYIAMDIALALATETNKQWSVPAKHNVLYLAGEGQSGFVHNRIAAWIEYWRPNDNDSDVATYGFRMFELGVPAIGNVEHWDAIRDDIDASGFIPSLIIVDTMARLIAGMDENSAKDITLITSFLESIALRYQCFVLGIHHTGKDVAKGARGSSAFLANMDSVFQVTKLDNRISLQVKKHRDADSNSAPTMFQPHDIGNGKFVILKAEQMKKYQNGENISWLSKDYIISLIQEKPLTTNELCTIISHEIGIEAKEICKRLLKCDEIKDLRNTDIWSIDL